MERFVKGDVVVVPFPFSDLSSAKRRPALVVTNPVDKALILCQITSRAMADSYAIPLMDDDFNEGGLRLESYIRPNRLFTADSDLILYRVGILKTGKMNEIIDKIVRFIQS